MLIDGGIVGGMYGFHLKDKKWGRVRGWVRKNLGSINWCTEDVANSNFGELKKDLLTKKK